MSSISRFGLLAAALLAAGPASATVEISTKPTQNMNCSGGVCTPTAKDAVLNVNDLTQMLASADTAVKSTSLNRDIEIDAALSWTSAHALTFDSYRAIAFNAPIAVAGSGALTITTNDGGSNGDFRFFGKGHVTFSDLTSGLVINNRHFVLVKSIKNLKGAIHADHGGFFALAKSIDAKGHPYSDPPIHVAFKGIFEGLGNTISNLNISSNRTRTSLALFGSLAAGEVPVANPTIRDLGLVNVTIAAIGNEQNVGTFAGYTNTNSFVLNCYATGTITANNPATAGGLVGFAHYGSIQNSFSSVAVSATGGGAVGGLAGEAESYRNQYGFVKNSYASGAVAGGDTASAGGLIGTNLATAISNSYATGSVTGGSTALIGGLVGNSLDGSDHAVPKVSFSYSTGAVTGGPGTVGGLIGIDKADAQNASDYWDLDTSGVNDASRGAGNIPNDPGLAGLSDAQLKSGLPSGFDSAIWAQSPGVNNGYPYLIDNPAPK